MKSRFITGFVLLIAGFMLTGISIQGRLIMSADSKTDTVYSAMRISLYVGIALIIASGVLFATAALMGVKSEREEKK